MEHNVLKVPATALVPARDVVKLHILPPLPPTVKGVIPENIGLISRLVSQFRSYLVERGWLAGHSASEAEAHLAGLAVAATGAAPAEKSDDVATDWQMLRKVIEEYFEARRAGYDRLEDSSAKNFRSDFRVALSYFEFHHEALTEETLTAYLRWLELAAVNPRTGKPYLRSTLVRKKTALSSLLTWAGEHGHERWKDIPHTKILKSPKRDKRAAKPHLALDPLDTEKPEAAARKRLLAERVMALLPLRCGRRAVDVGKLE